MVKTKFNPIIVVLIIIIFIIIANQKGFTGAGVGEKQPLMITDLENINGNGLNGPFPGAISDIKIDGGRGGNGLGVLYLSDYIYTDFYEPANGQLKVIITNSDWPGTDVEILAGNYVTIIYDGGQNKKIYLPHFLIDGDLPEFQLMTLYVATTGETFYDSALTQDACTISNGCIFYLVQFQVMV